jgi:hypothetical protein
MPRYVEAADLIRRAYELLEADLPDLPLDEAQDLAEVLDHLGDAQGLLRRHQPPCSDRAALADRRWHHARVA